MDDGTNKYYYHFDGLGSVTEITDDSGAIVEKYEYDVYGNTAIKDASDIVLTISAIGNPYGFTGRELDSETGLYYYRARYYSPELGRFLQTDPIGYYDSMNLYSYCGNDPVNWIDPYGLWIGDWWSWKGAGQGALNVLKGVAIGGAIVLGATFIVVTFPVSAPIISGTLTGLAIVGSAGVGLTAGQVLTGQRLSGAKICGEERSAMTVEALARLAALIGYAKGWEFKIGKNFRFAPFGNRTGHRFGELPHYHTRIVDPVTGKTISGGGIRWHHPYEKGW